MFVIHIKFLLIKKVFNGKLKVKLFTLLSLFILLLFNIHQLLYNLFDKDVTLVGDLAAPAFLGELLFGHIIQFFLRIILT